MSEISLQITTTQQSKIVVENNSLLRINEFISLSNYSQVVILSDQTVAKYWLEKLENIIKKEQSKISSIIILPGEKQKNLEVAQDIWKQLSLKKVDRKSLLICLGGGVVGDLGGFVASTYQRGIDYMQIPTTLLAQVDSSVGGKTGLDFLGQKNNLGTFSLAKLVICDPNLLATLPHREFVQGFGEILKYALIWDFDFWEQLKNLAHQKNFDPQNLDPKTLEELILKSLEIKTELVNLDPSETRGQRKLLNFGHTFGHAVELLELAGNKPLFHGEAVAIGMVFESILSQKMGFLDQPAVDEIITVLTAYNLPTTGKNLQNLKIEKILELLYQDKKTVAGKINWTLLESLGAGIFDQDIPQQILETEIMNFLKI